MNKSTVSLFIALFSMLLMLPNTAYSLSPITNEVKIVAFGDSLVEGYRLDRDLSFPARLQQKFHMEGYTGVKVYNEGVSGMPTRQSFPLMKKVYAHYPDIVLIVLGANDMLKRRPVEEMERNLARMIGAFQDAGITVILAGIEVPIWAKKAHESKPYHLVWKRLADEYNVTLYPHFLKGVFGKPEMNQGDGIHPNNHGTWVIVSNIFPLMEKAVHEHVNR